MKRFFKWTLIVLVVLVAVQLGFYLHATTSPQWEYAKRALANKSANYDLRYCIDLPEGSRKDFSKTSWKPLPCINTATSLYNDKHPLLGPLCANTVIRDMYVHYMPIHPFLMVHAHGFYKVRYYRYYSVGCLYIQGTGTEKMVSFVTA